MTSTFVDGDLFAADAGALVRFVGGKNEGWTAKAPKDDAPAPGAELLDHRRRPGPARGRDLRLRQGRTSGSWRSTKIDGKYVAQYRLAGGAPDWADLRAMYVIPGVDDRALDARLDVARRRQPGHPRRRPGQRPGAQAPAHRQRPSGPAEGDPEADQEALTGPPDDPAAGRQSDPADTGRHARRLVIACFVVFAWELGLMASGGETALDAFITEWGVVPADLTAAWGRGDYLSHETATLVTSQFLHGGWFHLLVQHALPVDLREQRRGSLRSARVPRLLSPRRRARRASPRSPSTRPRPSRRSARPGRSRRRWGRISCSSRAPG